jgi:diguanylate cyclase
MRVGCALGFGLLILAATLGGVFWAEREASHGVRRAADARLAEVAGGLASRLDREMEVHHGHVVAAARLASLQRLASTPDLARSWVSILRAAHPDYSWVGIADQAGRVVAGSDGLLDQADVSAREWFQRGRGGIFVGDVHEAVLLAREMPRRADDEPWRFVDIAVPLYDGGNLAGVLGVHVGWDFVGRVRMTMLTPTRLADGIGVLLTDRNGVVLSGPPGSFGRNVGDILPPGTHRAEVPTQGASDYRGLGWRAVAYQPQAAIEAPVRALQARLLMAGTLVACIAVLLGWWLAERLTRPLVAMAEALAARQGRALPPQLMADTAQWRETQVLGQALAAHQVALETERRAMEAVAEARMADLRASNAELRLAIERAAMPAQVDQQRPRPTQG